MVQRSNVVVLSRNECLWNFADQSLDARELRHFGVLLGFVGDKFAEIGGRAEGKHRCAEVGEPCLEFGIGETSVDFLVELVDDSAGVCVGTPTPSQLLTS
jgi:hypothetical protein